MKAAIVVSVFSLVVGVAGAQLGGIALGQTSGAPAEERPLDVGRNPPSLSEKAHGFEASIPAVVQRKLDADPELRGQHIKVAGNMRRNVTLSGEVTSAHLRKRAGDLAQGVSGVQHVHNDLRVITNPNAPAVGSDAATTDRSDPAHALPQRE